MSKVIRILDLEKFYHIEHICKFYGIAYEEVTEDGEHNIPASSESGPSKTKRKSANDS